jgi:NAD(P)-dependent dehydrogenase (short-subunit alcohol dehydrogenase family)
VATALTKVYDRRFIRSLREEKIMDFSNRVAMVTGGTGALGTDVVLALAQAGARVAVPYRRQNEWEAIEQRAGDSRGRLYGSELDLTKSEAVGRFVQDVENRWGRLDLLFVVVGGFAAGRSYETDEAVWNQMISTNLLSLVATLRAAVPVMIRQNFGRIVTVSSGAILRGGGAGIAAYAVSKGAVRQLSEILADELKEYDIRVHCVMPGTMETAANRQAMPKADTSKWVKTEEVARVMLALASDDFRAARSVVVPVLG